MVKCPKCGTDVQPAKTWQLVSPLPDVDGRITITVMGSFKCPSCGYSWRGKVSVMKVGPDGEVEFQTGKARRRRRKKEEKKEGPRGGTIIEIDLSEIEEDEL
ncbi:MAG: chromatin protein Cren7 [Desulfurococcales archaeon]|nr:chromatin protein Cren7 [Desulfurococcales archaeon]